MLNVLPTKITSFTVLQLPSKFRVGKNEAPQVAPDFQTSVMALTILS